jgi:hypothetical protein
MDLMGDTIQQAKARNQAFRQEDRKGREARSLSCSFSQRSFRRKPEAAFQPEASLASAEPARKLNAQQAYL